MQMLSGRLGGAPSLRLRQSMRRISPFIGRATNPIVLLEPSSVDPEFITTAALASPIEALLHLQGVGPTCCERMAAAGLTSLGSLLYLHMIINGEDKDKTESQLKVSSHLLAVVGHAGQSKVMSE